MPSNMVSDSACVPSLTNSVTVYVPGSRSLISTVSPERATASPSMDHSKLSTCPEDPNERPPSSCRAPVSLVEVPATAVSLPSKIGVSPLPKITMSSISVK